MKVAYMFSELPFNTNTYGEWLMEEIVSVYSAV